MNVWNWSYETLTTHKSITLSSVSNVHLSWKRDSHAKKIVKRYSLIVHLRRSNWISEINTGKTWFLTWAEGDKLVMYPMLKYILKSLQKCFLRWHKTINKVVLDHHPHSKHLLLLTYLIYQKSQWYWCLGFEISFMVKTKSNYHYCGPKRKT